MSVKEKPYCIITGAAGDIGRCLVRTFNAAGYSVIATDIRSRPEEMICEHYLQVDLERTVTDIEYGQSIFATLKQWLPDRGLKVLINNAAIQILGGVEDLSLSDWQTTLDVNLLAPFIWTQALLKTLEKAQGSVVNVSSIHAHLTKKNFVAYATSKAALSGMTRAMAVDLGPKIRINAIEPAAIETEMLRAGFENNQSQYQELQNCHPQNRIGLPEEVAQMALNLTDDRIKFLHGSCIQLDGGISSRLIDPE